MDDEEKKFLTDLVDKERDFHMDLAKIGMRFGVWFAVGVAVFAIGATILFTIYEHVLLEGQLVEGIGLFFIVFGVIITTLAKCWTSTTLNKLKKKIPIETEKTQHCNVSCKLMNRLSRLVLKSYEVFVILILPSFVIFLIMYYPYGFQPNVIGSSETPSTAPDLLIKIHRGSNPEVPLESDGSYKINQDYVEKSNLSKTIMNKIFGSTLGLNDVCFHNINSTYYLFNYKAEDIGIRFTFNNNSIVTYPGSPICEPVMSNTNFLMELDQGITSKDFPDVILKNLYSDKDFQEYTKENNITDSEIKDAQLRQSIFTEVYVQTSGITLVIAFFIIFTVWSGFVFLCRDLRDFIR